MLVTTYQHDYLPPFTRRYDFLKSPKADKEMVECQCSESAKVEPPPDVLDQCKDVEWTNIAPNGKLLEPRLIPTNFSTEQLSNLAKNDPKEDCMIYQPNRFLRILRTAYPDLYERLKMLPKEELNRRIERERTLTTYQIDYCNVSEYPEGVYESLSPKEDSSKLIGKKLLNVQGHCAAFRSNVMEELERQAREGRFHDPCEKAQKPLQLSFGDSSRFIASGNSSHWRTGIFTKRANFSEYMDTINKCGCMITKNNIHDHSKCRRGAHCLHKLVETCANLK